MNVPRKPNRNSPGEVGDLFDARGMNPRRDLKQLYLWLNAEGWIRFGPYEWLRCDDDKGIIVNQDGTIVAKRRDDHWTVDDPKYLNYQFRNPTITSTPRHPHPKCGEPPFYV